MLSIRKARSSDHDLILELLAEAYGVSLDFFPRRYPSWWGEDMRYDTIQLAEDNGTPVSLVRIFPLHLILNHAEYKVGGIGSVATRPSARGQGGMRRLMETAIEEMTDAGFDFSVLWGDRHRYGVFGFEPGGEILSASFSARSLSRSGIEANTPRRFFGSSGELDAICRAYAAHPFRRKRSPGEAQLLYNKSGLVTWTAGEGNSFGYLALFKESGQIWLAEFGGSPETVLSIMAGIFAWHKIDSLTLPFPGTAWMDPLFERAATSFSRQPAASVKILSKSRFEGDPSPFSFLKDTRHPLFIWPLDHV